MTSWRIASDAGVWGAALAAAALLGALALRPWARGLPRPVRALRAAAWLLVAALLAKPALHGLVRRTDLPRLAVLLDLSPSMASADDEGRSRLERAARWLLANRDRLARRAAVTLYAGAGGARRLSWDELPRLAAGRTLLDAPTALGDVSTASPPPERVWLISDGAFDAGEPAGAEDPAAQAAARLDAPLDVLGVGPREERPGLAVEDVQAPDFVFLHGRFTVSVRASARQLAGKPVRLTLRGDGGTVGSRTLTPSGAFEMLAASFTVDADRLGRRELTVEAASGALTARRSLAVDAIRQKYRIMYLAGRPSVEYSQLRHQLKSDPNHELVSFVILRNPENVSPVPDSELSLIPFPASEIFETGLSQFDLFILQDFAYWRFNLPVAYLENLRRFVARGGALLVISGSNALAKGGYRGTPLEQALPVTLSDRPDEFVPGLFRPRVAAPDNPLLSLGLPKPEAAALWNELPPLDGWTRFSSVRPGATVLLAHPTERTAAGGPLPVVAVQDYGKGKVMLVGTDSTWRWKLGGGKDWRLAGFYARFWSRAVEYLTGSLELKKVAFSPLPDRLLAREPLAVTLRVFDENFRPLTGRGLDVRLSWERPDGSRRSPPFFERAPGVFDVELTGLAEGRHRLTATALRDGQPWGSDTISFRWEPPRGEEPLERGRLKLLADAGRGRYEDLARADAGALLAALPAPRREEAVGRREALWDSAGWGWLLALVLLAEWALRRRGGYL